MRKSIFMIFGATLLMAGLHSCMDFDTPSDEFTGGAVQVEPEIQKGKADSIDYRTVATEDEVYHAIDTLQNELAQMITAQFYMRGGKDGGAPGAHMYQYAFNTTTDNYVGYLIVPHNDFMFAGTLVSTYSYHQQFGDGPYGALLGVKNNIMNLLNHPSVDKMPEIKALGLLWWDYVSQEMTDIYGTIPYVDHKANKESNPFEYNRMEEIYYGIVDNLDTITACFKHFDTKPDWYKMAVGDLLWQFEYCTVDKSFETWARFANSLKLRMAMHIVKVNPAKAKEWAEEAIAAGVIETTDQEVYLDPMMIGFDHPLLQICAWGDTRLNASFESILHSYNHPYLQYLFDKNAADIVSPDGTETLAANTRVIGIRGGTRVGEGQGANVNPRINYSQMTKGAALAMSPLYLMKISEVQFLRAEGAIRGWNMGGDAATFYEQGVRNGQMENRMGQKTIYAESMDAYLSLETALPYTHVDPLDHSNDIESVTKVGVKWNEGDDQETKLEKIITQKYIAAFPYSYEPWVDMRRTGYPRVFPVLNAEDGDGSLAQGDLIRKIPLPGSDTTTGLTDINTSGIPALGGSNTQGTRVWWDVEGPNF